MKTLHPAVHGGLLAKRDNPEHMAQAAEHGIEMIDMVVVNLYAFEKTVESGADFGTCIENIDIGGPSMLRSAAKNFASVAVVTDPASYGNILAEMRANDGATTLATRTQLALRVFQTTNAVSYTHLNRDKYPQYRAAVDDMFRLTSTHNAPWIILESDDKYYARVKALRIINEAIEKRLGLF